MTQARGCCRLQAIVALVLCAVYATGATVGAQGAGRDVRITSPVPGDTVRGVVEVVGSATLHDLQFSKVECGAGVPPTGWFVVDALQTSPVVGGRLALWDTRTVPDGVYTLRLQAVRADGNFETHVVSGITVGNRLPTASPTPTPTRRRTQTPTTRPTTVPSTPEPPTPVPPTPTPVPPTAPPPSGGDAWEPATVLSTSTDLSWFPAIVADPTGQVHVVYSSGYPDPPGSRTTGGIDVAMHTSLGEVGWSAPVDVVNPGVGGYPTRPRLAVGPAGELFLSYRGQSEIYFTRAPLDAAHTPQAWQPGRLISGHTGAYYSDIAVDRSGIIHLVWNEVTPDLAGQESAGCPDCMDIYYRRSTDGGQTWSTPENLSRSPGGSTRVQVDADSRGTVHVVWEEGIDYSGRGSYMGLTYRRSLDGGATWEPANTSWTDSATWTDAGAAPFQPVMASDGGVGGVMLVWRTTANESIYYQLSADGGGAWSAPEAIPGLWARPLNDTPYDTYDLAIDSLGHVHLLAVGSIAAPAELAGSVPIGLYHLTWDGERWSAPGRVYTEPGMYPEWPQSAVAQGNRLHVTWFVRHEGDRYTSDEGQYAVLHSAHLLAGPGVAPVRPRTPTATLPTPTRTPPPPAPATLLPTVRPIGGGSALSLDDLYSENARLLGLVLSLAPIAGVLAIVLLVRRARRP